MSHRQKSTTCIKYKTVVVVKNIIHLSVQFNNTNNRLWTWPFPCFSLPPQKTNQSPLKCDQKCKKNKNFDKVHLLSMDMKKHLKYDRKHNVTHYATMKTFENANWNASFGDQKLIKCNL